MKNYYQCMFMCSVFFLLGIVITALLFRLLNNFIDITTILNKSNEQLGKIIGHVYDFGTGLIG